MVDLWIPLTVAAALIQTARSVWQRKLAGRVSVISTTYARFFYGAPIALVMLLIAVVVTGDQLFMPPAAFVGYMIVAGIAQVLGNALFIHLIRASNFAVMTTFAKMETVLSALFSFLLVGDTMNPAGIGGIVVALLGVMTLAAAREERSIGAFLAACTRRPALSGMAVGALYAVSSTSFRAGALLLEPLSFVVRGLTELAWVTVLQTVAMGLYLLWTQPAALRETVREWRLAARTGLAGALATGCWLSAFALQKTGYVLAVGQIELVFATIAGHMLLKERMNRAEIAGIGLTLIGILLAALAG